MGACSFARMRTHPSSWSNRSYRVNGLENMRRLNDPIVDAVDGDQRMAAC